MPRLIAMPVVPPSLYNRPPLPLGAYLPRSSRTFGELLYSVRLFNLLHGWGTAAGEPSRAARMRRSSQKSSPGRTPGISHGRSQPRGTEESDFIQSATSQSEEEPPSGLEDSGSTLIKQTQGLGLASIPVCERTVTAETERHASVFCLARYPIVQSVISVELLIFSPSYKLMEASSFVSSLRAVRSWGKHHAALMVENEVLKVQLKKYVGAVQMLKREGSQGTDAQRGPASPGRTPGKGGEGKQRPVRSPGWLSERKDQPSLTLTFSRCAKERQAQRNDSFVGSCVWREKRSPSLPHPPPPHPLPHTMPGGNMALKAIQISCNVVISVSRWGCGQQPLVLLHVLISHRHRYAYHRQRERSYSSGNRCLSFHRYQTHLRRAVFAYLCAYADTNQPMIFSMQLTAEANHIIVVRAPSLD
ncbi:hypothetical protein JZ751_006206 [Albula glossodonta]|uniref:Uncharacterized protein n=1 Tax=Albula glossodonta TaxID=121402 RepID=A0A8T2N442_9TELE|nr:hypothetical protein JZ751_006206 [Albula glossodonta]